MNTCDVHDTPKQETDRFDLIAFRVDDRLLQDIKQHVGMVCAGSDAVAGSDGAVLRACATHRLEHLHICNARQKQKFLLWKKLQGVVCAKHSHPLTRRAQYVLLKLGVHIVRW